MNKPKNHSEEFLIQRAIPATTIIIVLEETETCSEVITLLNWRQFQRDKLPLFMPGQDQNRGSLSLQNFCQLNKIITSLRVLFLQQPRKKCTIESNISANGTSFGQNFATVAL